MCAGSGIDKASKHTLVPKERLSRKSKLIWIAVRSIFWFGNFSTYRWSQKEQVALMCFELGVLITFSSGRHYSILNTNPRTPM